MLDLATRPPQGTRLVLARLLLVAWVAACGPPPELDKQLETLESWKQTLQLAQEEHGAGAISTRYATQLRDAARSALNETRARIGQTAHTPADSSHAAAALDSLRDAIRQLSAETGS